MLHGLTIICGINGLPLNLKFQYNPAPTPGQGNRLQLDDIKVGFRRLNLSAFY